MTHNIEALLRLRRVAAAMAVGAAPTFDDALDHAAGLLCYLDKECRSLVIAFDLDLSAGQRDARTVAALADRDQLIRQAVAQHFALEGRTRAAAAFAVALSRYRVSAWRFDRKREICPVQYGGTLRAVLFEILKASDSNLSARRVAQICETSFAFRFAKNEV